MVHLFLQILNLRVKKVKCTFSSFSFLTETWKIPARFLCLACYIYSLIQMPTNIVGLQLCGFLWLWFHILPIGDRNHKPIIPWMGQYWPCFTKYQQIYLFTRGQISILVIISSLSYAKRKGLCTTVKFIEKSNLKADP